MPWRRDGLPTSEFLGFPDGSDCKESSCNMEDLGSVPGLGRFPQEEGMATHSSILAWRIPWTEKPGGLQSMGLQRVGHYLATKQQQWSSHALSEPAVLPRSPCVHQPGRPLNSVPLIFYGDTGKYKDTIDYINTYW